MITDIFQQYLREITKEDIRKEGFRNIEKFIKTWTEIYSYYDPHELIWVVEF